MTTAIKDFIQTASKNSIAIKIYSKFKDGDAFRISEAYGLCENANETVRARIYENLGLMFEKVGRGVYRCKASNGAQALIVQGDGRDLSQIPDESIDAIFTDHPWDDNSVVGSARNFIKGFENDRFLYTQEDFNEKYRVLKKGHFLIESLPEISCSNWKYLNSLMEMADKAGFRFYCQVAWKKGKTSINMGIKKRNKEILYFFSKGAPRKLRAANRKTTSKISGTVDLLPAEYDINPVFPKKRVHPTEKPIRLPQLVVEQVTEPGEIVLDQFMGSGNTVTAALSIGRHAIGIELQEKYVKQHIEMAQKEDEEEKVS
jgi:DNA modification methylase